jgi:CxxC motif-containing protein (DUF1111 family)
MTVATLDEFIAGSFFFEMKMTNPQKRFLHDQDAIADPEITAQQLIDVANFVYFSPPPGRPIDDSDRDGLASFHSIGCADCHEGNFTVEGTPAPQMYSDLLAHDLGPDNADTLVDEGMPPAHFRTTPLWGLRDHPGPYLHNGSAATLEDAIHRHGGEGTASRDRFEALPPDAKARITTLLKHL